MVYLCLHPNTGGGGGFLLCGPFPSSQGAAMMGCI